METLIATLSLWIAAQTGLATTEPPRVEFVGPKLMTEIAFGPSDLASPQLRALYSRDAKTIYLKANWNAEGLRDRSELVHELVHHFQNIHKLTYACAAARERLAYDLQIAWLREQGIKDPYELLDINVFFIVMASVCRDADHD